MTPITWLVAGLGPALQLLPPTMDTPEARAMLTAIALQESRLQHRRQIQGPARSYLQFEQGGIAGVLRHHASKPHALEVLSELDYPADTGALHAAFEHNDVLAAAFGRLLLFTLPQKLPGPHQADAAWGQYIDAWRPGKPHRETWDNFFISAWSIV